MLTALCAATIFTSEALVDGHALLISEGVILDIVKRSQVPAAARIVSYPDRVLVPGFIDAQVNGGNNILFNNTPTAEACIAIANAHQKHGTTRLLPTCITDQLDIIQKAIAATRTARKKHPGILGIHIEGPHLGLKRRGVHKPDYIRAMTAQDLKLYHREDGEVMLMTVAPENVDPKQIEMLRQDGIIISLGHTSARSEQIHAALAAGATGFTHLFNGMGGLSARGDGPAEVALDDRNSWCSVIADHHHVKAEMIRLAVRAKPPGKVFLVSDAMPPAASNHPKPFQLYDETITLHDGRCVNSEGKLAGSAITMADAVHNCIALGIDLEEALRMASTYPAAFLGLDQKLGKLLPGYEADLVVIDARITIGEVWVKGEKI